MRSDFEKAYEPNPHKSPFTEVRFNEEKQIYEPLNPPLDRVARSLNAAWYGYRIRQTEVDELQYKAKLRESDHQALLVKYQATKKCWEDISKEKNELQKRVDVVKREVCIFSDFIKRFDEHTDTATIMGTLDGFVDGLEQALKGGEP